MKHILLFVLLITMQIMHSQEQLTFLKNSLKTSNSNLKDVIPIVNQKNGDISLFLVDAKKIYGYLLDDNFKVVKKMSSEEKSRKFRTIVGNSISENNDYRLYLTNNKEDKFVSMAFSYKTNSSSLSEIDIDLKNEIVVETVVHQNKFYLITIEKKSSRLNIYSFDDEANYKKNVLDFSNNDLVGFGGDEITLAELLSEKTLNTSMLFNFSKAYVDIVKVEENNPNPIDITSKHSKLYHKNGEIIISLDQNKKFTQLISISLDDFEKSYRRISKPFKDIENHRKEINSYIHENILFIVGSTREKLIFSIRDYDSGTILKEYSATTDEPISFKNSPIIQVGGAYKKYREMEKSKKFLRKITQGDIGVSVHKINDKYQILLGGKVEVQRGGGFGAAPIGMPTTTTFNTPDGQVTVHHTYNPTFNSFNSYSHTKSTYIKCLFDADFNHLEGAVNDNVFDKIKSFREKTVDIEN